MFKFFKENTDNPFFWMLLIFGPFLILALFICTIRLLSFPFNINSPQSMMKATIVTTYYISPIPSTSGGGAIFHDPLNDPTLSPGAGNLGGGYRYVPSTGGSEGRKESWHIVLKISPEGGQAFINCEYDQGFCVMGVQPATFYRLDGCKMVGVYYHSIHNTLFESWEDLYYIDRLSCLD